MKHEYDNRNFAAIADALHDQAFSIDTMDFNRAQNVLHVPIYREPTWRRSADVSVPVACFDVYNVSGIHVDDPEKLVVFTINELHMRDGNTITVETNEPMTFEIKLASSDIRACIEIFDERYFSWMAKPLERKST